MRDSHTPAYGLGLRRDFYEQAAAGAIAADWLEAVSENFMDAHPGHLELLADIARHYPLALHGVAMNIAGLDPLDDGYFTALRRLANAVRPVCLSDHLCWTSARGVTLHDLLPVPYTEEALLHVARRVNEVQDRLSRGLVLENPSTYGVFAASSMPESEFLARLCGMTGCGILLDLNNVQVTCFNHGQDPKTYIDALPVECVAYLHLAGHQDQGTHLLDTHDAKISVAVWDLYRHAVERFGPLSTVIEWDAAEPPLALLLEELEHARSVARSFLLRAAS